MELRRDRIKEMKATLTNKEEFEEGAMTAFCELDVDKNGTIDKEELRKYARKMLNQRMLTRQTSSEYAETFLHRYDTSKDGAVSYSDFKKAFMDAIVAAIAYEEAELLAELPVPKEACDLTLTIMLNCVLPLNEHGASRFLADQYPAHNILYPGITAILLLEDTASTRGAGSRVWKGVRFRKRAFYFALCFLKLAIFSAV